MPNLIGSEDSPFKNLIEFANDQYKILKELNKRFEPYIDRIAKENVQVVRNQAYTKIKEVKDALSAN